MLESPGLNSTDLGIDPVNAKFLVKEGLAMRSFVPTGIGGARMHQWTVTERGKQILRDRTSTKDPKGMPLPPPIGPTGSVQ